MTIVDDSIARRRSEAGTLHHDVVMGRCSQKVRAWRYNEATPGCQELLAAAGIEAGRRFGGHQHADPVRLPFERHLGDLGRTARGGRLRARRGWRTAPGRLAGSQGSKVHE